MFSRFSRTVGWLLRFSTLSNAYECQAIAQSAKRSISGPSGRKSSIALVNAVRRASGTLGNGRRPSVATASAGTRPASTLSSYLKQNYDKYQMDTGVPVYLKGGPVDRILFGITTLLIAIGLMDGFLTLYKMAYPKKQKK